MEYNKSRTEELSRDSKYSAFTTWLTQGGAVFPKVQYPAVFGSGPNELNGCTSNSDIDPKEVICAIPNKLLISTETARQSELGEVFRQNPDVFIENTDRDYLTLIFFLMYERSKGSESKWHPYFEAV